MQGESGEDRNVIPRWHPLPAIERNDLASISLPAPEIHAAEIARLTDDITIWRKEGGIAAAADLFDAYLVTGDRASLQTSIALMRRVKGEIPERLREAVAAVLQKSRDPLDWRRSIAFRETDESYLRQSVAVQKRAINAFPRDSLGYLELARLYTVLGNYGKAEHNLHLARTLAPNHRIILRSTMQFYNAVGDLDEGLKIIRRASILKFDPWVQSAEIAASTILDVGSKAARKNLIDVKSDKIVPRRFSELAMAMATLERANGVKERKVFQLVKAALPNSTENGFAQAIWLSNRSSREFLNRFPEAKPSEEAYEAKVDLAIRNRSFDEAAGFAELWVADQPFSIDAVIGLLNLRSIHVRPNDESKRIALRAIGMHPDNWHILNACVLLLSEAGDFDNAQTALAKLERSAPDDDDASPYVAAAAGYLAFARGDLFLGRIHYDEAIKRAKRGKNQYSVINAFMFWFRAEAINKLLSKGCVSGISLKIERALLRLQHSEKRFLENAWHSIKLRVMTAQCENTPMEGDAIFDNAASYIDEPLLIPEPFNVVEE